MNEILYNTPTHAMLHWASVSFQENTFQEYLDSLESDIWDLDESPEPYIMEDITQIIQLARKAQEFLWQDTLIGISPDDSEWPEIFHAYERLDHLVYMASAMDQLIRKKLPSFADQCLSQLDDTLEEISDCFYERSPIRWVPFNEMRQSKLQSIDPLKRYQFPWYELMADEPSDLISMLATHFHQLNDKSRLPESLTANLSFYLHEVHKDKTLSFYLARENAINQALTETFEKHWALRLWHASKYAGYSRIIPEEIEKEGMQKIRQKIFKRQSSNPQNKLILDIADSCFGPGYTSSVRAQKLFSCESQVSQLCLDPDTDSSVCSHAVAVALKNLETGQVSAEEVAESLLDFWYKQMEQVAVPNLLKLIQTNIENIRRHRSAEVLKTAPAIASMVLATAIVRTYNKNVAWQRKIGRASKSDESVRELIDIEGLIFAEAEKEADMLKLKNDENLKELHANIQNSLGMPRNIRPKYYYQAIYFQNNKWNSLEKEKRIKSTPIQIDDLNDITGFILLIDQKSRSLNDSTTVIQDMLNQPSDDKQIELKPTTVILFVNVVNTE